MRDAERKRRISQAEAAKLLEGSYRSVRRALDKALQIAGYQDATKPSRAPRKRKEGRHERTG